MSNDETGGKQNTRNNKTGRKTNRKEVRSEEENIFSFSSGVLPPVFGNVAICLACGKEKHVNTCGFCEECWVQYSHLRKVGT